MCYTEFGAADERSEKVWYTGLVAAQISTAVRFPKVVYDTFAYRHPFGTSVSHTVQVCYTEFGAADERSEKVWYTGWITIQILTAVRFPKVVYDTFAYRHPFGTSVSHTVQVCYTEVGAADERSEKVRYTGWITIQISTAVRFPSVVYDTFAYRHPFGTSVSHTVQVCYTEVGAADERSEKVWYTGWITIQISTAVRFPKVVYDTFAYRHPFGNSVSHSV